MSVESLPTQSSGNPPRLTVEPSFWKTFLGVWSFTWRSRITPFKAIMILGALLFLPVLVYLTVDPVQELSSMKPSLDVERIARDYRTFRVNAQKTFPKDRFTALLAILTEEKDAIKTDPPQEPGQKLIWVDYMNHQAHELKAYQKRVTERTKGIFDIPMQFEFFAFHEIRVDASIERSKILFRREISPYYHWLTDFYFFVVLPFYCLSVCGALIRDELQGDTLGFLLTRPSSRTKLFLAKFLSHLLWVEIFLFLHTGLLLAVGAFKNLPDLKSLALLFLGVQILAVAAWAGLSAFLGLVTKRYLVLGIVYGFIIELGIGRIPTNINSLSVSRHLKALLSSNPSLDALYEWSEDNVPFMIFNWTPNATAFALVGLLLAFLIFVGFATAMFTFREYNSSDEMQR